MSRLYYENQNIAPSNVSPNTDPNNANKFLDKVSSIVPAEIIAGYIAMVGFMDKPVDSVVVENQILLWGIFIFCALLTPIYFYIQAEKNKPKVIHIILSTIAFAVWAYVTSGEKFDVSFYKAETASIILVAFSLVSGLIPLKR